jgi:aminoglycoside phosphotransferase (APT) family kinase protein
VHLAAAADDAETIALLRRPPAAVRRGRGMARVRARTKALARRVRGQERMHEAHGVISVRGGAATEQPAWLRDVAAACGVDIDDCRVGLVAAPDYPSRKAILFLRPTHAQAPRYVVKMPRDGAFNERLENEWRVLSLLADGGIGDAQTVPRPAFFGYHAGLAVLGQTTIDGEPFRQKTTGTASCGLAWSGIRWLEALGAATATTSVAGNAEIAAGLHRLLTRYSAVYRPSGEEQAALAGLIDRIGACDRPLPLVFQHGDPGTWNLLITRDGRPAFLDWEAAEPHGMPLWDLFYFMRSFGIGVAGATGGDTLQAFADQFLFDTAVSHGLAEVVERHCERVGIDRSLVEPLFFTCWMHRALKESMRLAPGKLDHGRYVRLLRLCLERRDAPALHRLF